jgi:hemolysin activation/secretion protein
MIPYAGDYWVMYGVVSKSNISAVGDFKVIGNGNIVGMRYIHPLPALKTYYHSLTLGVDYKDFKETVGVLGSDSFNTPIAYTPFNIGYDATLKGEDSTTQLNTGVTFSVRGLGNDEDEFNLKRFKAQSDFAYIRAGVKHTQTIYKGWQVYANVNGQLSSQPLISSEQFVAGGLDTVRGYLESSALGDQGINTSLELRTPPLAKYVSDKIADMHVMAFYDAAHLSINDPIIIPGQPPQIDTFNLASYGLGVRLKGWHKMFAQLEIAKALRSAGPVVEGDTRLHFRVGYDW